MGLTYGPTDGKPLTVVGFSGLAVEGAAGVRAPVFAHTEGWYFMGDPDAPVAEASRWAEADLQEIERRGTICLTSRKWARVRGGVVLYAHPEFVRSGEGRFDLHDDLEEFYFDRKLGFYVHYLTRDEALGRMRAWAERLLKDAGDHLRPVRARAEWERALDSAERAGVVTPPELGDLRVEAFVLIGAAWIALDKNFDDVLWDAETEHDENLVRELERRARPRGDFVKQGLKVVPPVRKSKRVLLVGSPEREVA